MSQQRQTEQKPPPRWVLKFISKSHVFLNRITGGRGFNTLAGDDVCFVTMVGAKSGRQITIPLMYIPYDSGVLLVASQAARPKTPFGITIFSSTPISRCDTAAGG